MMPKRQDDGTWFVTDHAMCPITKHHERAFHVRARHVRRLQESQSSAARSSRPSARLQGHAARLQAWRLPSARHRPRPARSKRTWCTRPARAISCGQMAAAIRSAHSSCVTMSKFSRLRSHHDHHRTHRLHCRRRRPHRHPCLAHPTTPAGRCTGLSWDSRRQSQ